MHKRLPFWISTVVGAIFLAGAITGCGNSNSCGDGGVCPDGGTGLTAYIGQASTVGPGGALVPANQRSGSPSTGTSGPSVTQATPNGNFVPGGSNPIQITSGATFNSAVVWVQGVAGYYEFANVTVSGNSITIIVTFGTGAPQASFTLNVALGTGTNYGPPRAIPVQLDTRAGTGALTFALNWDIDWDLDLYVVEPGSDGGTGYTIYYGQKTSPSGGRLDVDSNAACNLDHLRSEHVTWPNSQPPHGTYMVKANCYQYCPVSGPGPVTYTLTATAQGRSPMIIRQTFNSSDCLGGGIAPARAVGFAFTY